VAVVREGNKLTALEVAKRKKPGRYSDGHGLWLQISSRGTKAWLFRYMIDGRARHMGLGPLHTVSLAEARTRARQARQLILDGKDPIEVKYEARQSRLSPEGMAFKEAAQRFIEVHDPTWRSARHRQQWRNTLLRDHASSIANRPITAIDGALITSTLAPIWTRTPETAKRVKQRIERVVQWVRDGMPAPYGTIERRHHSAMPFVELPGFMRELRGIDSIAARALEFTVLTGGRTSEVLKAAWEEIDTRATVWTIPAERMKANKLHRVPLSDRAMRILHSLPRDGSSFVFAGSRVGHSLSADSLLKLLQRLRPGLTVHGLRSSFRDWACDRTAYPRDVIEMALAHSIKDKSEAAY
jgi:integrase